MSKKIVLILICIGYIYLISRCTDNKIINDALSEYEGFKYSDTCIVDMPELLGFDFESIYVVDGYSLYAGLEPFTENDSTRETRTLYSSEHILILFVKNNTIVKELRKFNSWKEGVYFSVGYSVHNGGYWDGHYGSHCVYAEVFTPKLLVERKIKQINDSISKYIYYIDAAQIYTDILFNTEILKGIVFDENGKGEKDNIKVDYIIPTYHNITCGNIEKFDSSFISQGSYDFVFNKKNYFLSSSSLDLAAKCNDTAVLYRSSDKYIDIVAYRMISDTDTQYCAYIKDVEFREK